MEKLKREFEEEIGWMCGAKLVATEAELEWEDADIDVQKVWDWVEEKINYYKTKYECEHKLVEIAQSYMIKNKDKIIDECIEVVKKQLNGSIEQGTPKDLEEFLDGARSNMKLTIQDLQALKGGQVDLLVMQNLPSQNGLLAKFAYNFGKEAICIEDMPENWGWKKGDKQKIGTEFLWDCEFYLKEGDYTFCSCGNKYNHAKKLSKNFIEYWEVSKQTA